MRHIPQGQPPQDYAQRVATNPNATWDDLRDVRQGQLYANLRDALVAIQQGLCAFCEIDLIPSDLEVEHWHPKTDTTGPTNWAIHFPNLQASCRGGSSSQHPTADLQTNERFLEPIADNLSCGAKKGELIPEGRLLRPLDVPPTPSAVGVDMMGHLSANEQNCHDCGVSIDLVNHTIDELGLDCPRLQRARMRHWQDIATHLGLLLQNNTPAEIASCYLRSDANGQLPKFFSTLRSFFGRIGEDVLRATPQHR